MEHLPGTGEVVVSKELSTAAVRYSRDKLTPRQMQDVIQNLVNGKFTAEEIEPMYSTNSYVIKGRVLQITVSARLIAACIIGICPKNV